jgi:thermitase
VKKISLIILSLSLAVAVSIYFVSPVFSGKTQISANNIVSEYELATSAEYVENVIEIASADRYSGKQWYIDSMGIHYLWQLTMGSSDVVVAILDTGIDAHHEDIDGRVIGEVNFTDSETTKDVYGHGTFIAGIIAANSNETGITGIAPDVKLLNVKVADDRGRCNIDDVVKGILWATDNGADIINISIEIKDLSPELKAAVDYAWGRGILIVAAAGNNGNKYATYPAICDNVLSVAAIKADDSLCPLSNHDEYVDLAAPGYQLYSPVPGNGYDYNSGTSFSAAIVSGIAALIYSVADDINNNGQLNDEVMALIESGCMEIDINGVGWGKINAYSIYINLLN